MLEPDVMIFVFYFLMLSFKPTFHSLTGNDTEDLIMFLVALANRWENNGNSDRLFSWVPKSLQMVTVAMKLKDACSLKEKL